MKKLQHLKRKKGKWIRHQLFFKSMVVLILIFIIPILILYSLMMKDSTSRIINDVGSRISTSLQNLSIIMDEVFISVESVCNQMRTDAVFSELSFSSALNDPCNNYSAFLLREQVSRSLYQYYLSNSYIDSLEVYNSFCNVIFSSAIGSTRKTFFSPDEASIQRVMGPDGRKEKQWFWEQRDGKAYLVTYFSPCYSQRPTLKLYARIALSADVLMTRFQRLFPEKQAMLLIRDASQELIALGETWAEPETILPILSAQDGWTAVAESGESYLTVWRRSDYTPWLYVVHAPVARFSTALSVLDNYFVYFTICLLCVLLLCLLFLYTQIIRPMQIISSKMRQAEHGDFSVRIHFRQKDELGYVGHRFNVLLYNTQNLIRENYETRMRKNEFELKFIQTQLKEHFIYNTLDSIHWIANQHKVPQISEIIFSLSHFFRLTLNSGKEMVTVSEAKEILSCYLSLINIRMDHMIDFQIDVESGLEDEHVVKYLFQPVVENAFQHGIRARESGRIRVSMTREGNRKIRYLVEDNGIGMTAERLQTVRYAILHHTAQNDYEDCFALINIDRQLKMYFGYDYSFEIESKLGVGTQVTLIFPIGERGAVKYAENDHH